MICSWSTRLGCCRQTALHLDALVGPHPHPPRARAFTCAHQKLTDYRHHQVPSRVRSVFNPTRPQRSFAPVFVAARAFVARFLTHSPGFRDSAYVFERDSKADRLNELFKTQVQPGHLIYLIQRGLQYEELRSLVERVCGSCLVHSTFTKLTTL